MFREKANQLVDSLAALILLLMAGIVALQIFFRYILKPADVLGPTRGLFFCSYG